MGNNGNNVKKVCNISMSLLIRSGDQKRKVNLDMGNLFHKKIDTLPCLFGFDSFHHLFRRVARSSIHLSLYLPFQQVAETNIAHIAPFKHRILFSRYIECTDYRNVSQKAKLAISQYRWFVNTSFSKVKKLGR